MSREATGLVLVSHSALLAAGAAELAAQMAPDVVLRHAGGTDDARLGTSFDVVERAIAAELDAGCTGVVVVADIGSARMTAESVIESLGLENVVLAPGAFVEGSVAAAVAAQTGGDLEAVRGAVSAATRQLALELPRDASDGEDRPRRAGAAAADLFPAGTVSTPGTAREDETSGTAAGEGAQDGGAPGSHGTGSGSDDAGGIPEGEDDLLERTVVLRDAQGLHARPAALLVRLVASFDAQVQIQGVDAGSLLRVMALGLGQGAQVQVSARGAQAAEALDSVVDLLGDGGVLR